MFKRIDLLEFIGFLSKSIDRNAILIADSGSSFFSAAGRFEFSGQRLIIPGAQSMMGWTLPAIVGAYFAEPQRQIVGLVGDGGLQFNIQELQTIKHHGIPAIIVVLNNGGYLSIKNTAKKYFGGKVNGVDSNTGLSFPDTRKIAKAYGFEFHRVYRHNYENVFKKLSGQAIVETMLLMEQVL